MNNENEKNRRDPISLDDLIPRQNVKGGKSRIIFGAIKEKGDNKRSAV